VHQTVPHFDEPSLFGTSTPAMAIPSLQKQSTGKLGVRIVQKQIFSFFCSESNITATANPTSDRACWLILQQQPTATVLSNAAKVQCYHFYCRK
jgi:hypothetical protein